MGETLEEIQQPVSPTMVVPSDSEESTESTLGLGPGLSGMDLSGDAEGRGADPRNDEREGADAQDGAEGEFLCRWGTCSESFSHVDLLASHVTCVHATSGENGLFYCGWRGCSRGKRGFNARYKMLIHVRTHTNEKPHRCPRCDKSFSRAENLKIHARSHTGERPYVCPVPGCGKAYSNSSDRFKHTRTHSVERPYACRVPGCSKRYTDPSSLRKHVKTYAHYHRPATEGISKDKEVDVKDQNKASSTVKVDIKSPTSDVSAKMIHSGKNNTISGTTEEVSERNLRNLRPSARKTNKVGSTVENERLPSVIESSPSPLSSNRNNLERKKSDSTSQGDLQECNQLKKLELKNSSPTSWDAVPDDKWLENDIEEVEEDENDPDQGDYPSQQGVGMSENYCVSDETVCANLGHQRFAMDGEWSSGAEEEWMSDGSDYTQNGRSKAPSLKTSSGTPKSSRKPHYSPELQLFSKLNKKNSLLSKSCQQKLDDLLLKSYSRYGVSQHFRAKNHCYQLDSFQPMDFSCAAMHQRSQAAEKCWKVLNDMTYHSVQHEQVLPLDLRKVN